MRIRPGLPLVLLLFLFAGSIARLDRFFLKENDGFCIHNIYGSLPQDLSLSFSSTLTLNEWDKISKQRFHYLTRGHQSYVFASEDQNYILKFYRFPSHMRRFSHLTHPFSYKFSKQRQEIKAYNVEKLKASFQSFSLAFNTLKEETGLLTAHLTPNSKLHQKVVIQDRLGTSYTVELGKLPFLLQKRATLIFPYLDQLHKEGKKEEIKKVVTEVIKLIRGRCDKGIIDRDAILEKNYGWLENRAIHIDVGRFESCPTISARQEIQKITHTLKSWLENHEPALLEHYLSLLAEAAD